MNALDHHDQAPPALAAIAHQIRSPLTAALLCAGQLDQPHASGDRAALVERLQQCLLRIDAQLRDMLLLVGTRLPIIDRPTLLGFASALLQALAERHDLARIRLRVRPADRDHNLQCATSMLVGALDNLVENALQAGANRVDIDIALRRGHVHIRIADDGPGIDPAVLERLGELFVTTKAGGTGLGIPVAASIAAAHHGRFRIGNRRRGGAVAAFLLPCSPQPVAAWPRHEVCA